MKKIIFIIAMLLVVLVFASEKNSAGDTTIKAVWRENTYDPDSKQSVNVIVLNEEYFSAISEPEKAILAYLATITGNECDWDGSPNGSRNNVKCKILDALKMDYQCSETNRVFLSKWFADEPEILKDLQNCRQILYTASSQSTFSKIDIIKNDSTISVKYSAMNADIKENKYEKWTEELTFIIKGGKLDLMKRVKKKKK